MFGLHKNESQTARILRLLKKHGDLTNRDLNRIAYRYSARILELRNEGHKIVSVHEKDSLWRYVLVDEDGGLTA